MIQSSLPKALSYKAFEDLIDRLLAEGKTTGEDQSEFMVSLTKLNRQRMKRIDNTLEFSPEQLAPFQQISKDQLWLVISEAWCADGAQIVPVLAKIAQSNPLIDLKIVLRDENPALMDQYLTNGGKAIPILIIADAKSLEVLHVWGPRPKVATQMVEAYKKEHGKLTPEFKEELQKWYNQDKGQSILGDLQAFFK
ncbi:MAG: thioredoxin family protein [Capnocytophaga sp.]|jgi:hypothetical protein|uniref:thioredoxin family protein n=1 Tax=Capnocytophaga sp. oral taxon 863 TaxID=1227265 RepID=UPI000398110D|nr:thioredoxin family protein [Capnocytophaga sp. oral taxon 863]ERI64555.1 hypothetical protein HMPREF1551_00288 [Capnocytophaga sp. oral taxon 863 str. F0517]RKW18350.1 MAG: thioredoxin family protein [Capnocytophaga sp.]